jgi:serine-threonine kinase receptor-associated protein
MLPGPLLVPLILLREIGFFIFVCVFLLFCKKLYICSSKRKLWDALTGSEVHTFSHKHIVKSVDFSLDSTKLITGCNDKNLRLFDLNEYNQEPLIFSGHTSNIKKCIFSDNSNKVMSISDDKTLRVWDTKSGQEITNLTFSNVPTSIEVSRDGQLMVLAQGNCVELYEAANLLKINSFNISKPVTAATIHPDKSLFVCGDESFTLYKYSISNGAILGFICFFFSFLLYKNLLMKIFSFSFKESFKGHFGPIHSVQFSPGLFSLI